MELILLYSGICVLIFLARRINPFRFDFLYTLGLFFSALLAVMPLLDYPTPVRFGTALFLILFHFIMVCSFNILDLNAKPVRKPDWAATTDISRTSFVLIKWAAICFCYLSVANSLSNGDVPVLSSIDALAETRSSFDYTSADGNLVERLLDMLSHFGILFLVLSPLYVKYRLISWFLPFLVAIFIVDHSFSSGGRASIILSAIAFVAVYFSLNRMSMRHIFVILLPGVLVFYYFAVLFYMARNPVFYYSQESFLAHNCAGANFHPLIMSASSELKALNLSLCYFSSPPYHFQLFMDQAGWTWQYAYGSYNLGFLFRDEFVEMRLRVADLFQSQGLGANPWSTFARDMFIDYGYFLFGAAFVMGFGIRAIIGVNYRRSDMHLARFGLLASAGFMAPFMSPLLIRPIIYPIMLSFLVPLCVALVPRKNGRVGLPVL
jgi:hypothetical protein